MAIEAIDVHVHVRTGDRARAANAEEQRRSAAAQSYFRTSQTQVGGDEVAEMYRAAGPWPLAPG